MYDIEFLLDEKPRAFITRRLQDGTIVYTYAPHDEHYGWSIVEHSGNRVVVPAIGKLKYPFRFQTDDENDRVYVYPTETTKALKAGSGTLLIKYDGYWTMAWEFNGETVFRTREKPFIGRSASTSLVLQKLGMKERVKKYVRNNLWPMFEVWGSGLERFSLLSGGTRVDAFESVLGVPYFSEEERRLSIHPTVIGMFSVDEGRWLEYDEFVSMVDDFYVAEPLKCLVRVDEEVSLDARTIFGVMNKVESWNLKHGMKRARCYVDNDSGRVVIEVPHFSNPQAVLEGGVVYAHSGHLYRGFKVKSWTVFVVDVYAKKKPPKWRIKQELIKVLSNADEVYYAQHFDKLVRGVLEYLAEDYKVTRKMEKYVRKTVLELFAEVLKKNGVFQGLVPRELAKMGIDKRVIGALNS